MTLMHPSTVVWELIPFEFGFSDESLRWLRQNSWGDCSLLFDTPRVDGRVDDSLSEYDSAPNPRS